MPTARTSTPGLRGIDVIAYAIPGFLPFAILLIVLFAGGSFWSIFPLRGLTSDNFSSLPWPDKIADYFWHIALRWPMALGAFATMTLLTKNSFLDDGGDMCSPHA